MKMEQQIYEDSELWKQKQTLTPLTDKPEVTKFVWMTDYLLTKAFTQIQSSSHKLQNRQFSKCSVNSFVKFLLIKNFNNCGGKYKEREHWSTSPGSIPCCVQQ